MIYRRHLLLAAQSFGIGLVAVAGVAVAQPTQSELVDAGRKVLREAAEAASKNDWATCRTKAAGVWDKVQNFKVAGLLGICEVELRMFPEGAEHLSFYLANDDRSDAERTAGVKRRYELALKEVSIVDVACAEAGAHVKVGGKDVGPLPRTLYLPPGSHTVSAEKVGFAGAEQDLTLKAGERRSITITLRPSETVASAAPSTSASSAPSASVSPPVPSGSATVEPPPASKSAWPAVVLFGAGAVAAGVGVGLTVAAEGDRSDVGTDASKSACRSRTQTCATVFQDRLDDADVLSNVGIALFAVAGAAIVGGVIYLAVPVSDDATVNASVTPWVSPQGAGAAVRTSF